MRINKTLQQAQELNEAEKEIKQELLRRLDQSAEVINNVERKITGGNLGPDGKFINYPVKIKEFYWLTNSNHYKKMSIEELMNIDKVFLTSSARDVAKLTRSLIWGYKNSLKLVNYREHKKNLILETNKEYQKNIQEINRLENIDIQKQIKNLQSKNDKLMDTINKHKNDYNNLRDKYSSNNKINKYPIIIPRELN